MSPKPWEVTDDDLAQGLVPAGSVKGEESDDAAGGELLDGDAEYEELEDPWSTDLTAAAPVVTPARPIETQSEPRPESQTEVVSDEEQEPAAGLSGVDSSERDREPDIPEPSAAPPAPTPQEQHDPGADFDDADDDFWDEPVAPDRAASGAAGYDLGPSPAGTGSPAQPTVPAPGMGGDSAGGPVADSAGVDDEDPDDSITVTLRRNRETQQVKPATEYRTSTKSRRPVRPSERRHKMDAAPVKQGPMARMKKMLTGDADVARAHESSAKRDTIRPLNVVVLGKKGGVGKTVVTTLLGHTFASVRKDRVLAVDASPTGGNLSARCPKEGRGTVVSLLDQLEYVTAYANVREHTAKGDTGLEVLGSDVNRPQRPVTGDDYRMLMDELRRHYQLILSYISGDFTTASAGGGEGIVPALLDEADLLVLVAEGVDGANAATWLVNWLKARLRDTDERHLEQLLDDLIVVVTSRTSKTNAKPERIAKYFSEEIARRVVLLPFDPIVEGGLEIDYNLISPKTRKAMLELADAVTGSDAFTGR